MEVHNGKKMNFKRIYSQIAKYGKTIPELANEYGMEQDAFLERIEMGLDPKLYSRALKVNERNLKNRQNVVRKTTATVINLEGEEMSRKNEVQIQQNYRQMQSEKDKEISSRYKKATMEALKKQESGSELALLEVKLSKINSEIKENESNIEKEKKVLLLKEAVVTEKEKVLEEATKDLSEAKKERDEINDIIAKHKKNVEDLENARKNVTTKITEIKNKTIYLVGPGYKDYKPEFGSFISTVVVEGYENLLIVEPDEELAIEPELKDMLVAGYDSYKEYVTGLRFVMLCIEYVCKNIEHFILVDDDRLKILMRRHME